MKFLWIAAVALLSANAALAAPPKDEVCDICVDVLTQWKNVISDNAVQDNIRKAITEVCSYFPESIAQTCVDQANQFLDTLIKEDPKNLCAQMDLCGASKSQLIKHIQEKIFGVVSEPCDICVDVVSQLKDLLSANGNEIRTAITETCGLLPQSLAKICNDEANNVLNQLLSLDPKTICTEAQLCGVAGGLRHSRKIRQVGDACEVCKYAADYLINELRDNKTEAAIVSALEEVCSVVPVDATTCKSYVDHYAEELVELLQKDITADEICASIGLCSQRPVAMKTKKVGSITCEACDILANYLINELQDNKTDEAIKAALEKVCSVVPIDAATCASYVDKYADELIELLQKDITADELCATIGLCSSQVSLKSECSICTLVAGFIKDELKDGKTDDEILGALTVVCKLVPSNDVVECQNMIETYGKLAIDILVDNVTADEACKTLGLC